MDKLFLEIINNMEEEKEIYNQLIQLSEKKTELISNQRISDLDKLVGVEEEFIIRIGKLEDDRHKLLDKLGQKRGQGSITLSNLIEWSQGKDRDNFIKLRDEFNEIIEKLNQLNQINAKLIRSNLDYVEFAIQFMTGENRSGQVYESKGETKKISQSRNLFDSKA